jgi:hypothetical protein
MKRDALKTSILALQLLAGAAASALAAPPKPVPPPKQRPMAPVSEVQDLARANFRRPSGEEMSLFYALLRKKGGQDVQIATVPTGYRQSAGSVVEIGAQFATFYGDVDGDRRGDWILGCYFPTRPVSTADPLALDNRARIAVFTQGQEGWQLWLSTGLGYEFSEPQFNREEVEKGLDDLKNLLLPIALVDVDADGRMEVTYHCRSHSAALGGLPGIYRREGDRWLSVAPQADRFSLQDLDGDRKLEVITGSRRIGHGNGDDDVPRVWRWRDRQFREASGDYPQFYAGLAGRYNDFVKRKEAAGEAFDRMIWERAIQKATLLSGRPSAGRRPVPRPAGT